LTDPNIKVLWVSNKAEIIVQGLPAAVPSLRPARDKDNQYLFMGMFPLSPKTNPPPPELFGQVLGRKNLVYYDWEFTPERLLQSKQFYQMYYIGNGLHLPGEKFPTQPWMVKISSNLTETATEITVTSPTELTLVRKSRLGFTGFELAGLMSWIESPHFPLQYELPPKRGTIRPPVQRPSTNSPPAKK
jgi:hypothetical protein